MRRTFLGLVLFGLLALPAAADKPYILRAAATDVGTIAAKYGLTIVRTEVLDGRPVTLVTAPNSLPQQVIDSLKLEPAVDDIQDDHDLRVPETPPPAPPTVAPPNVAPPIDALRYATVNNQPVPYYGRTVRSAYILQPAAGLIAMNAVHQKYAGDTTIVALIDTGVDPAHPALQGSLVPGYDFTRDTAGVPSEWLDLQPSPTAAALAQSTVAILDHKNTPVVLNQSTVAILDQSTVAILDASMLPSAFGHGTMVAGLIHLVAPNAKIMPLKAFRADGSSDIFQIIRAIYYAVDHGARVINMSFSLASSSPDLTRAIGYASAHNVICVASAGNDGQAVTVYPAGYSGVIGVGSTSNFDIRSAFSNYGTSSEETSAPGEGLITTYPGNNYAGVWGTSFSAALVSGGVALIAQAEPKITYSGVTWALDHGQQIQQNMGKARLQLQMIFNSL